MVRMTDMLQPGRGDQPPRREERPAANLPEIVILTAREEVLARVRDAIEERGFRLHPSLTVEEAAGRRKIAGDVLIIADRHVAGAEGLVREESQAGNPALLLLDEPETLSGISSGRILNLEFDGKELLRRIDEALPARELPGGSGRRQVFTAGRAPETPAAPAGRGETPFEPLDKPAEKPVPPTGPELKAPPLDGGAPAIPMASPIPAASPPPAAPKPVEAAPPPPGKKQAPAPAAASMREEGAAVGSNTYREAVSAVYAFLQGHRNKSQPPLTAVAQAVERIVQEVGASNALYLAVIHHRPDFADVDTYLAAHQVNTAIYALKIAAGEKFSEKQVYEVALGAAVHDAGMTQLPDGLITRRGKLDQSGYSQVKQHPELGRALLKPYARAYPWLPEVIHQEHERWDGSGYPEGLAGEEIHAYARIIGLADTYEALTHGRPFRERMIPFNVLQQLIRLGGRLFQSDLVKSLIQEISVFPLGSFVRLNTGEVGRVISINQGYPLRPIVHVMFTSEGVPLESGRKVDLRSEPMVYITGPVELESGQ